MSNYEVWLARINNDRFRADVAQIRAMSPLAAEIEKCLKLEWACQNNPVVQGMVHAGCCLEDIVDALARRCNALEKEIEKLHAILPTRNDIPVGSF